VKAALDLAADLEAAAREVSSAPVFRGAALAAQSATDHELILAGPAESAKTFGLCWKLDSLLRATPSSRAIIVRKVRSDMGQTVLQTWKRITEIRGAPIAYGGNHPEWFDYPNGSRCYVVGMDRPGSVLSGEFSWIYVNQAEELTLDAWETLATRCTGRGVVTKVPMLMGDCNPGPPAHWILKRDVLRVLYAKHEDNPTLFTDSGAITDQGRRTLAVLDSLTGVRKERLRFGRWVSAEGVVYESFDRGVHVIEPFRIPRDWRRFRSIDFGFSHAFVCLWCALDDDGRLYVYREVHRTKRIVEDHATDIRRLDKGESIEATVADHDAEDRATLARHGVYTIAANKAVSAGIQAVQERLRLAGDGRPRVFVFSDALVERDETLAAAHRPTSLIEEFESYSWPKDAGGRAIKEAPVKVDDDAVDCLRYAVMYADLRGHRGGSDDSAAEAGEPALYASEDDYGGGGWGDER
jgi:phage terminase large subunit